VTAAAERMQFIEDLGPIQSYAKRCIHCGFCNAVCPTSNVVTAFKESRTSRGRVILLQSILQDVGSMDPYTADFKRLIDLCYSCRRCVTVCPAGIPIPDLMSHARYAYQKRKGSLELTLGHRIFANYGTFDRLGSIVSPVSNWMLHRRVVRKLMEWITHIDARAHLPPFHAESFESWFKKQPRMHHEKKVVYYVDSYANFNKPSLGMTVFTLLDHLGYEVLLPPQKESGMPAIEYGLLDKARSLARYNVRHLAPYARKGIPIVCSSPAASYLLREEYGSFLEDDDLPVVSKAVVDIAELLMEEYKKGNLHFKTDRPEHVIYHCCCLSKALSLAPITTKLLYAAGIQLDLVEDCCGGAGVWGTFKENYEMSHEIALKLRAKIESNLMVLTESETCRLQIEGHVSPEVHFPLELLAERIVGLEQKYPHK
jgi:Fe-S oxidoreductase